MSQWRFLATIEQAPEGFEFRPNLHQRDLRRGVFALFIHDPTAFEQQFGHLFERLAGLIIMIGETQTFQPLGALLYQLTIPEPLLSTTLPLINSHLTLINSLRAHHRTSEKQRINLERMEEDIRRRSDYSELIQEKLRSDLRQYTEWTVRALTDLLKFNALKLQGTTIDQLPSLIVAFLTQETFKYTGAGMLGQTDTCWKMLAHNGNTISQVTRADRNDVWHSETELYMPMQVQANRFLIVVSRRAGQSGFSDYEITFFQLLSTLLSATWEAKLLEQEVQHELVERIRVEEALRRRDAILEAVSFTSEQFLRSAHWESTVQESLERLGRATDVSRVYVYENSGEGSTLATSLRHQWAANGVVPLRLSPKTRVFFQQEGLHRWAEVVGGDRPLFGDTDKFPVRERRWLEAEGATSIAIMPIMVSGHWWGMIAFDEVGLQRAWNQNEIEVLKAAADAFGAALERRAAEQAVANAMRAKDDFLAGMSHELRTPLNSILGKTEALQLGVYGELIPTVNDALSTITESGQHLLALINDILDLAKIEAAATALEWSAVGVQALCESCLRLVRDSATRKNIKVFFTMDHDVSMIEADERRLKQILINLLGNAVKFTPNGGRVGMSVFGNATDRTIEFTVWDTGIGIAENQFAHLFEPFVQLDSSLSREFEGTGLGLALVKRLTEMHDGTVQVQSTPGNGSRFSIVIPWREPAIELIEEELEEEPSIFISADSPTPRILIVEDNELNREMLTDILEFMDYEVAIACNGREAIEVAATLNPDLILMDVQMPVMDGLEATRRLRQNPETAHLSVIAMTGLAMRGDRERCLAAGVDDYLSKPISFDSLRETMERYLAIKTAA